MKRAATCAKNERNGDTVNWGATCNTPQGQAQAEGTATYHGDTMDGSMKMKGSAQGSTFEMTQQMTGKYLGPF